MAIQPQQQFYLVLVAPPVEQTYGPRATKVKIVSVSQQITSPKYQVGNDVLCVANSWTSLDTTDGTTNGALLTEAEIIGKLV